MPYIIEHTDTFGGDPNYCWVNRYSIDTTSPAIALRAAKAACGLTGIRCRKECWGGFETALFPSRICQVVFIQWIESTDPRYLEFQRIRPNGHPVHIEEKAEG